MQERVEAKLRIWFNIYFVLICFCQASQTFFTIFHALDSKDSDETLRYKIGYFLYMAFFFLQSLMLFATFVFAWVIYIRLAMFLKPDSRRDIGDDQ